jgi:hypothetical protein
VLDNPGDFDSGANSRTLTLTRNAGPLQSGSFQVHISATSGPFTETTTIDVDRVPPAITSVTPTAVDTPQALAPGTEVTVDGDGFCPGTSAQFGNADATALADSINAAGTRLTVATPRLATDGPLTITSGGQSAASPQAVSVDSYRNTKGYAFLNYSPHITFGQMTEAFGASQTYDTISLCIIGCNVTFGDPFAMILNGIANAAFGGSNGGACFGVSLSSQRFLHNEANLDPASPPNPPTIISDLGKVATLGWVLFGSAQAPDPTGAAAAAGPPIGSPRCPTAPARRWSVRAARSTPTRRRALPGPSSPRFILLPRSATTHESLAGSGPDTQTVLGPGFGAQMSTPAPGGADALALSPGAIGVRTSAAAKPLALTLVTAVGNARRVAALTTTTFRGGGDSLAFDDGRAGLRFIHCGQSRAAGTPLRTISCWPHPTPAARPSPSTPRGPDATG